MFVLEITFSDSNAAPEVVYVRRPRAIIGSSEASHVVIEEAAGLDCRIELSRDLGRRFRVRPLPIEGSGKIPTIIESVYDGETTINIGRVAMHVTALDLDLLVRETEPSDRAGVRVLRQGCSNPGPGFPALVVLDSPPYVVSFAPEQAVYVGRARGCALRLDAPEVSSKHARVSFESGQFWIEDLGSTNGTFLGEQQVSGRVAVGAGVPIIVGRNMSFVGVTSDDQLRRASRRQGDRGTQTFSTGQKYPVLISVSEVARPARVTLAAGVAMSVGRDPSSDMWLGAPHISRQHCVVTLGRAGGVAIKDSSTNGTTIGGRLVHKKEEHFPDDSNVVMEFGGKLTVALCFSAEAEQLFLASGGAVDTFGTRPGNVSERSVPGIDSWATGYHQIKKVAPTRATMNDVRAAYQELSKPGRFAFVIVAMCALAMLTVVLSVLIPVLR